MILVFVAMYGSMFLITQYFQLVLGYTPFMAAARLLPMAMTLLVVSLTTPRLTKRYGAHRVVAAGMLLLASGFLLLSRLAVDTQYWYILACFLPFAAGMALAMSPMTASIMSAVPARRAGMGSAMNDATRELGAALGVAVLGSIAASRYGTEIMSAIAGLSPADQTEAKSSIAGALNVASTLRGPSSKELTVSAHDAFLSGVHLAVIVGATLAIISAGIVYRFLPRSLAPEGAMHGPLESLEDAAELGLGGVPPVFADFADFADEAS
jgi:Na+/melibiose symporter-like transporter